MGGKPILTHVGILHQAAFDHIPSHRTLQAAQQKDSGKLKTKRPVDCLSDNKVKERDKKCQADNTPQQAMEILPPEDTFEFVQTHANIYFLILWRLVILFKKLFPIVLAK